MALPYDSQQIYMAGETALVGAETWTSAKNYNYNNAPSIQSTWWTPPSSGGGLGGVGLSSAGQLVISSTAGGPSIAPLTSITTGTAWLNVPSPAAPTYLSPLVVGPITYTVPASGATVTNSGVVTVPGGIYAITWYVTLEANAVTPVIFDNTLDWCEVQVGGDVQAADMPPYPPYYPNLKAKLQFTNFPAGPSYEANAVSTMVFQTKWALDSAISLTCSFRNVSGTMSWSPATGGNPMVIVNLIRLADNVF